MRIPFLYSFRTLRSLNNNVKQYYEEFQWYKRKLNIHKIQDGKVTKMKYNLKK